MHCFLASDWLKYDTLPRKFRTLLKLTLIFRDCFVKLFLGLKVRSRQISKDATENEIRKCTGESNCGSYQGMSVSHRQTIEHDADIKHS